MELSFVATITRYRFGFEFIVVELDHARADNDRH